MEYSDYSGEKSALTCPCVVLTPFPIITWHPAVGASNRSIKDFCRGLDKARGVDEKDEGVQTSLDTLSPITCIKGKFLDTKLLLRGNPYICEYLDLTYLSRGRMLVVSEQGALNVGSASVLSWQSLNRNPLVLLRVTHDVCAGLSFQASKGLNHQCLSFESVVLHNRAFEHADDPSILQKQLVSLGNCGLFTFLDRLRHAPTFPASLLFTSPEMLEELFYGVESSHVTGTPKSSTAALGNMGSESSMHANTYSQFFVRMKNDMYGVGFLLLYLLRCMVSHGRREHYGDSSATTAYGDFLTLFLTQRMGQHVNSSSSVVCKHCPAAPLYTAACEGVRAMLPDLHLCAKCWLNPKYVIYPKFKFIDDTRGFVAFYAGLINSLLAPAAQRVSLTDCIANLEKYVTAIEGSFNTDIDSCDVRVFQTVSHSVEGQEEHPVLTSIRSYVDKQRLHATLVAHQDTVKLALATVIAAGGLGHDPDPAQTSSLHWSHDMQSSTSTYVREDEAQPYQYQASSYAHQFRTVAVTREPGGARVSESTVVDLALNEVFTALNGRSRAPAACIEGAVAALTESFVSLARNLPFKLRTGQVTPLELAPFQPSLLATCTVFVASYALERAQNLSSGAPIEQLWELYAKQHIREDMLPAILGIQYPPSILALPLQLCSSSTMTHDQSPIRGALLSLKSISSQYAAELALFELAPLYFVAAFTQPQPVAAMDPLHSEHPAVAALLKTQNLSRTSLHTIIHILSLARWKHSVHTPALQTTIHSIRLYLVAKYIRANFDSNTALDILRMVYQYAVSPSTMVATRAIINAIPSLTLTNTYREHVYGIYVYDNVNPLQLTYELHNSAKGTYYVSESGQKVYTGKASSTRTSTKLDSPVAGYILLHGSKYTVYGNSDHTDMYYIDDKGKTHTLQTMSDNREQHLLESLLPLHSYILPAALKAMYQPALVSNNQFSDAVQLKQCLSPNTAIYLYSDSNYPLLSGETALQLRKDLPRCFPASETVSSPAAVAIIKATLRKILTSTYGSFASRSANELLLSKNIREHSHSCLVTLQSQLDSKVHSYNTLKRQMNQSNSPFLLDSVYAEQFPLFQDTLTPNTGAHLHTGFQAFLSVQHTTGTTYTATGSRNGMVTFPLQLTFDCATDALNSVRQEQLRLSRPKTFANIMDNTEQFTQFSLAACEQRVLHALSLLKNRDSDLVPVMQYSFPEAPVYWQGFDSIAATATSFAHTITRTANNSSFANIAQWMKLTQDLVSTLLRKILWPLQATDNVRAMQQLTSLTEQMTQFHSPDLAVHLFRQGWTAQTFGVPQYLTLFSHQCSVQTTHMVWEALLFYPPELLVCLVVSALLMIQSDLQSQDVAVMAPHFFRFIAHIDATEWIQRAVALLHRTPVFLFHNSPWMPPGMLHNKTELRTGKSGLPVVTIAARDVALLCVLNNCLLERSCTTTFYEKPTSMHSRLLGSSYISTLTHLYTHFFKNVLHLPEQQSQQQTQQQQQEVYEDRAVEFCVTDNSWSQAAVWCVDLSANNRLGSVTHIATPQSILVDGQQSVFLSMRQLCVSEPTEEDVSVELALQVLETQLQRSKEEGHEPVVLLVAERSKAAHSLARKLISHGYAHIAVAVTNDPEEQLCASSVVSTVCEWGSSLQTYLHSLLQDMREVIATVAEDKSLQEKEQYKRKTIESLAALDHQVKKKFVEQFGKNNSNNNSNKSNIVSGSSATTSTTESHQELVKKQEMAITKIIQDTADSFRTTDGNSTRGISVVNIDEAKQRVEVVQRVVTGSLETAIDMLNQNIHATPKLKSETPNIKSNTPKITSTHPAVVVPEPILQPTQQTSQPPKTPVSTAQANLASEDHHPASFTFHDDGKSDTDLTLEPSNELTNDQPVVGLHFNFDDFDLDNLEAE